jgi:hypothetical protein
VATRKLTKQQKVIRELAGDGGEEIIKLLWEIANGRASYRKLARDPGPDATSVEKALIPMVEVLPTFKERIECAEFLFEHGFGKPSVDVNLNVSDERREDYGALTDEEIAQLKSTLQKVGRAIDVVDSVDADFTEQPVPKQLPEPTPMSTVTLLDVKDENPLYQEMYAKLVEEPIAEATRDLDKIFAGKKARFG